MNLFLNFLSGPVADALGWTLLHALWQGFALVLPTAILLHFLQNRSSELRYRLSVSVLLGQVLLSAITFGWYYKPAVSAVASATLTTSAHSVAIRWAAVTKTLPWHQQVLLFLEAHLSQFVLVYFIGVAVFALRLVGGWAYLQRLRQTARVPSTLVVDDLANQLREVMQISAVVRVRESARVAMPMVVGMLKPVLLLPVGLVTQLSVRELEAVLAHELAHVKRYDYAVNLLQSVVEVLYFFHPALWWLSARVREEREHCCDDLAVQAIGGNGRMLAQALARIEEIRLTNQDAPALAMAFAGKRQQLLHRVRRMLGVPTRPFVSNASLAGLTLATLLLVSMSVYAVQQPTPKPKPKPKSTQRFSGVTSGNRIDYGMVEGRMTYVVFNGQRLPKPRVDRLQRQLDQVLTGQLNLDTVNQPDRDILLTIFEKSAAFDLGMKALSEGMAHIDYDNIVTSALENAPTFSEETLKELSEIDHNALVNDALAPLGNIGVLNDSLNRIRELHQRKLDSLSQLIQQRTKQGQAIAFQMEKLRFPIEEVERAEQVLNWRKDKLMEQREKLLEQHQRLLDNDGKQKLNQADIEKQLSSLEPEIKKQEAEIENLNKELEQNQAKLEAARQPLEQLEKENEKLHRQMSQLSDQMGNHSEAVAQLIGAVADVHVDVASPRPARAPRPPKPAPVARPAKPARPAAVSVPAPAPPAAVAPKKPRP